MSKLEDSPLPPAVAADVLSRQQLSEPIALQFEGDNHPSTVLRSVVATLAPGESTGWHRHDAWQTGVIVAGRLRHCTANTVRYFGPGDVLAEPPCIDHEASNVADTDVVLVILAVHPAGVPLTTPRPAPGAGPRSS